jgi:hypothetical protein
VRTVIFVVAALTVGFGSLAVVPRLEPVTMATCTDKVGQQVRSSVTLATDKKITDKRLGAALRPLCREYVRLAKANVPEEDVRPALRRLVTRKPQAWLGICQTVADAELVAHAHLLRFMTTQERQRYRKEHCRLGLGYLNLTTFTVDWNRMVSEHPGLYAPVCASMIQHSVGRAALVSYGKSRMQVISRRACKQALREGVVTCGPGGFGDARVKQRRWKKIFAGEAKRVQRA